MPGIHECMGSDDDFVGRSRSGVAASKRNDAEGAPMIASLLNLQKCSGVSRWRQAVESVAPRDRGKFVSIWDDPRYARKFRPAVWRDFRRTSGYDDFGVRVLAMSTSNSLTGLTFGGGGDRTCIDDNCFVERAGVMRDAIAFMRIEAAAERQDFRAHPKVPLKTVSPGPVIRTAPSSRHKM